MPHPAGSPGKEWDHANDAWGVGRDGGGGRRCGDCSCGNGGGTARVIRRSTHMRATMLTAKSTIMQASTIDLRLSHVAGKQRCQMLELGRHDFKMVSRNRLYLYGT